MWRANACLCLSACGHAQAGVDADRSIIAFIEEHKVIDKIINHLQTHLSCRTSSSTPSCSTGTHDGSRKGREIFLNIEGGVKSILFLAIFEALFQDSYILWIIFDFV